ncbi:unnamed protein product, partial [Amoebophrya sp. A120]
MIDRDARICGFQELDEKFREFLKTDCFLLRRNCVNLKKVFLRLFHRSRHVERELQCLATFFFSDVELVTSRRLISSQLEQPAGVVLVAAAAPKLHDREEGGQHKVSSTASETTSEAGAQDVEHEDKKNCSPEEEEDEEQALIWEHSHRYREIAEGFQSARGATRALAAFRELTKAICCIHRSPTLEAAGEEVAKEKDEEDEHLA